MKNKSAFSLIELSIVLIIIGLLVAGVTGGASLIESARARAAINEIRGYRQAVMVFQVDKGRYPGDKNNTGKFGYNSDSTLSTTDLPSPYNIAAYTSADIAPWIELYLAGITDTPPQTGTAYRSMTSKILEQVNPNFYWYTGNQTNPLYYDYNFKTNNMVMELKHKNEGSSTGAINARLLKKIDTAMDDGLANGGVIRGNCPYGGNKTYDETIEAKQTCTKIWYDLQLP